MKKALKITSTISIILFAVFWIASKFDFLPEVNTLDNRNVLVLIYLFTSLKYYQMELKDRDASRV